MKKIKDENERIRDEDNIKNLSKNIRKHKNNMVMPESGKIAINLDSMLYPESWICVASTDCFSIFLAVLRFT